MNDYALWYKSLNNVANHALQTCQLQTAIFVAMSRIRNNFSNISSPYSSFLIKNETQRNFLVFSSFFLFS